MEARTAKVKPPFPGRALSRGQNWRSGTWMPARRVSHTPLFPSAASRSIMNSSHMRLLAISGNHTGFGIDCLVSFQLHHLLIGFP